jgi:murein DD-endopeptidase MepM/ murein hydrolase activator NlpD
MRESRTPGWRTARPLLWFALPAPVLVYVGASSPSIAQRVPRFLFPTLAVVGGGLLLFSFVNSVVQFIRRYRKEGRLRIVPLVANTVATIVLVVLPSTRFLTTMAASESGMPQILAGFGDWRGSEGYPRLNRHRGLDIAGRIGSEVLAAADGRVTVARDNRDLCGLIVVIAHDPHGYRTVYCHLAVISVKPGEGITRGQRIGEIGTTGQRAWPGYEHVHWELQRGGDMKDIEDPVSRLAGCFDETRLYPADRLVLTYPVKC